MLRLYQSSIRCCGHQNLPLACLRYYSSQGSGSGENPVKNVDKTEHIEDEDEVEPLPLLQRPLGVREPPTTVPKTRKEQLNDMLDQNKRMEHRRHLYVFSLSLVIYVPIC
jgi:ATPase complex subunit ATP10